MNKDEIRKIYLSKRRSLSETEFRELSLNISDLFFSSVDLSRIHTIHIYLPIETKREPDTCFIIDRIRIAFPHIRLVIPRVKGEEMENIFFVGPDQLESAKWGMLEPKYGEQADPQDIDMVLVPLLAVDQQGHRIGYGKGYYDRFLKLCRPDCIKMGVSFFEPEQSIEDKSNHDVLLNFCLTPIKIYEFRNHQLNHSINS